VRFTVRWADAVAKSAAEQFAPERSGTGRPSEYDFVSGPLAAAAARFADFESLPEAAGPSVRSVDVLDPVFGPVVFVGVLVGPATVEIAGFAHDPDYWRLVGDDPDE
jgi:hypothetical protein